MPASARYRTHDGTCNSRRRPRWGASQMPFNRFLPPEYGDGVDSIRMSVEGGPLASSRFVSLLVHGARDGDAAVTLMTAQWGQLLDHDMTSTAQPRSINGSVPSCCGNTDFHPSCFPIKVPLDDPWLAPLKVRCLEFLRSAPAQRRDCILSWREQTNQATSYIDASPIYSNSAKSSDNARVFRNGMLVYGRGNPAEDVCQRGAIATQCIRAGDGRSGEQPGLLALHHVWVGEHNRIALELSEMNLHWSDEKIYQETRRIVGAMFQHITYREFLPIVLGREVCRLFDLELLSTGYYQGYDPKTNPTVANSFAAAAFRFGHSLVQNSYMRCDRFHNFMRNNVSLHEEFQRGDIGSPGSLHRLLRGLVNQRALKRDEFITPELTNHLFQTPGFPFGLDLAAINIQRGRDHGVPPYTSWRVPCGLTPINSWEDFANVVGPQSAQRISHAYRSVHDIDLFVGGIAERPVVGGLVGPTFACIIAQQFSNSRKGDRFWYENGGLENSFTPAQLQSIRRVSLAQVLCRAVGGGTMQPHALLPPEVEGNERQVCGTGTLSALDLSPWIEQDPFATSPTTQAQEPDRVFEIITTDKIRESFPGSVQVVKENKAGFPNRVRPVDNKNSANGFVTEIKVPGEIIHISDKLDIRQKVTAAKRPIVTAKPIKGVNNKIDKNPTKITLNIRGVNVRRPQGNRHTNLVVNKIPIELRSATEDETGRNTAVKTNSTKSTNSQTTTESMTEKKVEARIDDTEHEMQIELNEPLDTDKHIDLSKDALNNTDFEETQTSKTLHKDDTTDDLLSTLEQSSSDTKDNTANDNARQSKLELESGDEALSFITETTSIKDIISEETLDAKVQTPDERKDGDSEASQSVKEFTLITAALRNAEAKIDAKDVEDLQEKLNTGSNIAESKTEEKMLVPDRDTETDIVPTNNDVPTDGNDKTAVPHTLLSDDVENEATVLTDDDFTQHAKTLTIETQTDKDKEDSTQTTTANLLLTKSARSTVELDDVTVHDGSDDQLNNFTDQTSNDSEPHTADLNPMERLQENAELTRLRRRGPQENRKLIVVKVPNRNNETKTRYQPKTTKSANYRKTTNVIPLTNLTTRSTSRQVELRQYQTQPTFYTRPQKVVVNGPNSDQYEIEINIRQTNKQSSSALPLTTAASPYKPFHYDKYSPSYVGTYYSSTIPPHAFYPHTPTVSANVVQTRRTKPPTVIYINEHEDRYTTTTRAPGLFQNILSFATSGFGNNNKPQQNQQQQSSHSTTGQKEHANYGASVSNVYENNQIYGPNADTSSLPHYGPRPTNQNALSAFPAVPSAASLSQVGGVTNNGLVQASSSAISTGNFGTIIGVAQANGADSTFSFNIRPKPSGVVQSQLPLPPNQIDGGSYGLLPSRNPPFNQVPNTGFLSSQHSVVSPIGQTHFGNTHKESANSPFSSAHKRPQHGTYDYYSHIQNLPLQQKTNLEHTFTIKDYDEIAISRTLEPILTNNTTNDENDIDDDDDDYDYGDDDLGLSDKFDQDGYIRPEHMIQAMIKSKENELRNLTANKNCSTKILDDNYVLPVLNTTLDTLSEEYAPKLLEQSIETTTTEQTITTTTESVTNFPDVVGKHLNNDILAEDYDDETTEALITTKTTVLQTLTNAPQIAKKTETETRNAKPILAERIAFAPIKILTKLERPDNWIIYDSPKNYPSLPELPVMNEDTSAPTDEIPMPIRGLAGIWQKKMQAQKDRNRVQFGPTEAAQAVESTLQAQTEVFTTVAPVNTV
uniref:Chorion peroxidase n=1 Tax=Zeugodacus cucurbitae TaxID=28588 RepID=A0A0A1XHX6_ZEUCU